MSEIMCSHQKSLIKAFLSIWTPPEGALFCQNKSQLSDLQNGQDKAFLPPHFWPLKTTGKVRNHVFHQKTVKKPFFYMNSPQGVLFCQNKSQLSDLQNGHREAFLTPPFLPIKNHWKGQKLCFLIRRVLRKAFLWPSLWGFSIVVTSVENKLWIQKWEVMNSGLFRLPPCFWQRLWRSAAPKYNSSYMFLCNNPCLQHPWWWSVNQ